jgi:DNA-binding NarL/FixJ family response regulator
VPGVLIVDDHPAVRAGLVALLEGETGLEPLSAASGATEALRLAERFAPEVAVLDISLQDGDGIRLCLELKQLPLQPRVLLYTASVTPTVILKGSLAGADGLVEKGAPAAELAGAIRRVMADEKLMPPVDRDLLSGRVERLSAEELSIVGLRLASSQVGEIADALHLAPGEVVARLQRLLGFFEQKPPRKDRRNSSDR